MHLCLIKHLSLSLSKYEAIRDLCIIGGCSCWYAIGKETISFKKNLYRSHVGHWVAWNDPTLSAI